MPQPNSREDGWQLTPVGRVAAPLREQVVTNLRNAILDMQLKPGQRLVERELIEQLGVSRTTIREALRDLIAEGLVTMVPQHGAVVSALSLQEAEDLYEIRVVLESLLVRHFVDRADEDAVRRLSESVDQFQYTANHSHHVREILAAKDRFYEVLLTGAQSPTLQQLLESVKARVQLLRATSLDVSGRPDEVVIELRATADAIARRDADSAAELFGQHVRNARDTALATLRAESAKGSAEAAAEGA